MELLVGETYHVTADDCCLNVAWRARLDLIVEDGDVDPITGDETGWPSPRTYWSNGLVVDGYVTEVPE